MDHPHEAVELLCRDGTRLAGHVWPARETARGIVVINPATGVRAHYYHRYAAFLARHGFHALTYDYRGVGLSRPDDLRRLRCRWTDWGEFDFEAALRTAAALARAPILVVGHSFGGVLPGLAANAGLVTRMMTVGAQYAWLGDYSRGSRLRMILKWHAAMPAIAALRGYFPGKRLGWLEDLPAGVAYDWAFQTPRLRDRPSRAKTGSLLASYASFTGDILAVAADDDPFATPSALTRGLRLYNHANRIAARLDSRALFGSPTGHFGLFHSDHEFGFWMDSLLWLSHGVNPWPDREFYSAPAEAEPRARRMTGAHA